MKTKTKWIGASLALGLALTATTLAQAPTVPNFSSRWLATPLHHGTNANGAIEGRIFERFVVAGHDAFPVGSVTYMRYAPKHPAASDSPPAIAAKLQGVMHIQGGWHERRQGAAYVYEALWERQDRVIRLYILPEKGGAMTMSVAMFRISYADTIATESEIIQRQLTHTLDVSAPWLDKMTAFLDTVTGTEAAWADGGCPPCDPNNPLSLLTCTGCSGSGLTNQLGGLNNNLNGLNNNAANANVNWNNTNSALNAANSNWATTNQQIANLNQNWNTTNQELHRSNDLLAKALDPHHALTLGLSYGLGVGIGMAAGGMIVSLAAEGFTAAVKAIYELATGEEKFKQNLQAFNDAFTEIQKLQPAIAQTEANIDNALKVAQMAADANPPGCVPQSQNPRPGQGICIPACNPPNASPIRGRECLILVTASNLRSQKLNSELIHKIQEKSAGHMDSACMDDLNRNGAQLDLLAHDTQKMLDTLQATDHQQLCKVMQDAIDELIKKERELALLRPQIEHNITEWHVTWDRQFQQAENNARSAKGRIVEDWKSSIDGAKGDRDLQTKHLNDDFLQRVQECASDHHILANIPILSIFAHGTRNECHDMYDPGKPAPSLNHEYIHGNQTLYNQIMAARQDFQTRRTTIQWAYVQRVQDANKHCRDQFTDVPASAQGCEQWADQGHPVNTGPNALIDADARRKYDNGLYGLINQQRTMDSDARRRQLEAKDEQIRKLCLEGWAW